MDASWLPEQCNLGVADDLAIADHLSLSQLCRRRACVSYSNIAVSQSIWEISLHNSYCVTRILAIDDRYLGAIGHVYGNYMWAVIQEHD